MNEQGGFGSLTFSEGKTGKGGEAARYGTQQVSEKLEAALLLHDAQRYKHNTIFYETSLRRIPSYTVMAFGHLQAHDVFVKSRY